MSYYLTSQKEAMVKWKYNPVAPRVYYIYILFEIFALATNTISDYSEDNDKTSLLLDLIELFCSFVFLVR